MKYVELILIYLIRNLAVEGFAIALGLDDAIGRDAGFVEVIVKGCFLLAFFVVFGCYLLEIEGMDVAKDLCIECQCVHG